MDIKAKLITVKTVIINNRAKIAVTTTALAFGALHIARVNEMNRFLTEHNLLETYYNPEDEI